MPLLPQPALAAGPVISGVSYKVTVYEPTAASITWTTDIPSDSQVNYGATKTLGSTAYLSSYVGNHSIHLTGLFPDTTYYFEVVSSNSSVGTSVDNNGGAYYSLKTTLPLPGYFSITLNPVCGVCGELIDVGTCGEVIGVTAIVSIAAPTTYHICWDSTTNVKETFTADTIGSYSLAIYTPEAKKGDHTVYLVDNTYATKASTVFTVLPSVKLSSNTPPPYPPNEGPAGTHVTLNGYGFDASQQLQIKFNDKVIKTTTASSVGSWTLNYTIPVVPGGGYTFDIQAKEGTVWVAWVSKYFKVTPKITVAKSSGTVGQTVAINGTGFASKEKNIEVTFGGKIVKKISYAEENGFWSDVITVPAVKRGDYEIDASGTSTRARDVPDVTFAVGPGILIEPISAHVGDTINVTGGGFAIKETGIRVYFDTTLVSSSTITADMSGCWQYTFTLPASIYGSHTVKASGDTTQPAVTNTLNVQPQITGLSRDNGSPGDSVSLTANGFHGNQKLTVTVAGAAASEKPTSQTNGNVVISFHVPKVSATGKQTLVVMDEGGASASVDFTLTKKTLSATPLPISPKDSTLRSGIVAFRWQGTTNSTGYSYTLEISETAAFSTTVMPPKSVKESSYTLTKGEALPAGTYYWRVQIVDDYGNEGAWSDPIEFTVSPIPTWVWVVVGAVVLIVLMVVAYRETKFRVTE
jgi:hypothetical protein